MLIWKRKIENINTGIYEKNLRINSYDNNNNDNNNNKIRSLITDKFFFFLKTNK